MNKLISISNFIIFIFVLLLLYFTSNFQNISNSILTIVPQSENKEILQAYNKYSESKTLYIAIKGSNKESYNLLNKIDKEILNIHGLVLNNRTFNQTFQNYKNEYQLYLKDLDQTRVNNLNIKKDIENIKQNLLNSFFPTIINKQDPLNLFKQSVKVKHFKFKHNYLVLENYGLLSSFKLQRNINSLKEYQRIYKEIKKIESKYKDVKSFSTIFYFVENSKAIKDDVNKIVIIALSILTILYVILLRNIKLLLNVIATLGTSAILSTILINTLFDEVSIFVLIFGISISTVAIDYMFHHHLHKFYEKKKGFNKEVFFGFLTTVIAFFVISFISFELIKQISIFTISSLLISYLHFSFLYPYIGFTQRNEKSFNEFKLKLKSQYILFISIILIVCSFTFINFDKDLRNLDYQNKNLESMDAFFKDKLKQNGKIPLLIKTDSINDLIFKYETIKEYKKTINSPLDLIISKYKYEDRNELLRSKQFSNIKNQIKEHAVKEGFKHEFFKEAYTTKKLLVYNFDKLKNLGIEFFEYRDSRFVFLNVKIDEYEAIKKLEFVKPLSMKLLFEDSLQKIKNQILILGAISLLVIILMVLFITKKNFLFSLTFLLFPLATILSFSYFVAFNILHIFMMFIILAISIDYAIYSSKSLDLNTKKAILFSLFSTFAGFGVLIFSNINSLFSIGVVATIGVISIAFLLIFTKRPI